MGRKRRLGIRDKDVSKQLRALEKQGYTVTRTRSGHVQVLDPEGRRVGWASTTSNKPRQVKKLDSAVTRQRSAPG